jgi:hypothetical protein
MRFGRHPKKSDFRTLRFSDYVLPDLPPPPAAISNLGRVYARLGVKDPAVLFPMDGNDNYGDCTIAAAAHKVTIDRGLVGQRVIMPATQVLHTYFNLTHGLDTGLNMLDVLNYWHKHKVGSDAILAFVSVNPKNRVHVQQAMQIFGSVYIGFQVPDQCLQQFDAHQPWTPGKLTNNGHAVTVPDYNMAGVTCLTWGATQDGTWAWWDECVDECYAILPPEAANSAWSPGFNLTALMADLKHLSGP